MNREKTAERLGECQEAIRRLGVIRLALFGSVRRGQARPQSDVDFLVQFAPGAKSYDRFLASNDWQRGIPGTSRRYFLNNPLRPLSIAFRSSSLAALVRARSATPATSTCTCGASADPAIVTGSVTRPPSCV